MSTLIDDSQADPLLRDVSIPTRRGIIPGSIKDVAFTLPKPVLDLNSTEEFTFVLPSESRTRAYLPGSWYCEVKMIAKKSDNTNITSSDGIALCEEASNLFFSKFVVSVNGIPIWGQNADTVNITRHVKDLYYTDTAERDPNKYGSGPCSYRQVNGNRTNYARDDDNTKARGLFNTTIIEGGQEFSLFYTMDHIGIFSNFNGLLPLRFPLDFVINSTPQPASIFQCADSVTSAPKLQLISMVLHAKTIQINDTSRQIFREAIADGAMVYTTREYSAQRIGLADKDDVDFESVPVALSRVPDELYVIFMKKSTYSPGSNVWKGRNRLVHNFGNLTSFRIRAIGGEVIANFENLDKWPAKMKLLNDNYMLYLGSNAIGQSSPMEPLSLITEIGNSNGGYNLGAIAMTEWDIRSSGVDISDGLSFTVEASATTPLTEQLICFICYTETKNLALGESAASTGRFF